MERYHDCKFRLADWTWLCATSRCRSGSRRGVCATRWEPFLCHTVEWRRREVVQRWRWVITETTKIDEKQPYIRGRSGIIEENTKQRMKAETCSLSGHWGERECRQSLVPQRSKSYSIENGSHLAWDELLTKVVHYYSYYTLGKLAFNYACTVERHWDSSGARTVHGKKSASLPTL